MHQPLLNTRNVDTRNTQFLDDYNRATSVFNDFFGPMIMLAHNALLEAYDLYDDDPRPHILRPVKRTLQQFDRFWANVRALFGAKHAIYIDFCIALTKQVDDDIQKLYLAFSHDLANAQCSDNRRIAWIYVADILLHNTLNAYRRFLDALTKETCDPRLAATFRWADPSLLTSRSEATVRAAHGNLPVSSHVSLALEIIAQRINSPNRQDDAAMKVISYQEHAHYRDEWQDGIDRYRQRREAERQAEQQAIQQHRQKIEQSRHRRERPAPEAPPAKETIAATLAQKFKVKRA